MPINRLFAAAAVLEALTLAVLFTNLALTHNATVTSAIGPIHGVSYLILLLIAARASRMYRPARWIAIVPGVGGLLSVLLDRRRPAKQPA